MIHAFQFFDPLSNLTRRFVLDVESGAVLGLDEAAYAVVKNIEEGRPVDADMLPEATLQEIQEELADLQVQGIFDSYPLEDDMPHMEQEPVIKSMCLHIAHDCNLRCKYCFADTGEFHGGRMLMTPEVGKAALWFLIKHAGNRRNLEVDLFGGEPLMNFDVVRQIVAYGRELERAHNKEIHFTITTNGVALNDDEIAFINTEMHNVVLSLDGRKAVHDSMRPTVNGQGSYDIILPKLQKLVEGRGEQEHYIRGTFTRENLDFVEDVLALQDAGFEQLSLEPVVLPQQSPYAIREEDLPAIFQEYDRLVKVLLESEQNGRWFNFFHYMVDFEDGPCLKKRIKGCGAGVEYVAVSPEGDLYPCHQFMGEKEYLLGNVLSGAYDDTKSGIFANCNIRTKPACRDCWAKYFCSGGCAANAHTLQGDIMQPDPISCKLLKKRTENAIGIAMIRKQDEEGNTT